MSLVLSDTATMPIPRNIDRLVKLNDQIAQSEAYRADITKVSEETNFEKHIFF